MLIPYKKRKHIVGPLVELVSGTAESEVPAFCKNLDMVGVRKH